MPGFVALLITIAIQGLLFASSWRIGASLTSRNFKLSLIVIFIITMAVSVFFSYSALLDKVYTPSRREVDRLQRAKLAGSKITSELNRALDTQFEAAASAGRTLLQNWYNSLNSNVDAILSPQRKLRTDYDTQHARLQARAEQEEKIGGTIIRINGQPFISPKGRGPITEDYEAQASEILYAQLNPLRAALDEKEDRITAFNSSAEHMSTSNEALTPENLAELLGYWINLASAFTEPQERSRLPPSPLGLREKVFEAAQIASAKKSTDLSSDVLKAKTVEELRTSLYDFISDLEFLDPRHKDNLLESVAAIGDNEGEEVHPFSLAIGEIKNNNPLAVGSLLVALSIDILVLFCGLMGARPDSYLDLKNPDDLFDIQESAVETIMSLDLQNVSSSTSSDPLTRRAIEIISRSEPDVDSAYQGFSAVITQDDLRDLHMSKEIGVLFALKLAEQLPDGRIGLRTRFILWLADQISRNTDGMNVARDLRDSLEQIGEDNE